MPDINTPQFWTSLLKKVFKVVLKNFGIKTTPPTFNQHVVPHPDGWAIKGAGNEKYTEIFDLQSEAIDRAKEIAFNYQSSVVIHRKDGSIRDRISYKLK